MAFFISPFSLLSLVLILVPFNCQQIRPSPDDIPDRIINGNEAATAGTFPYQISLQYVTPDVITHICGGAIIAPRWILTAAHCVTDTKKNHAIDLTHAYIHAGSAFASKLSDNSQRVKVATVFRHPHYDRNLHFSDVGLIKLDAALVYDRFVNYAQLPPYGYDAKYEWGVMTGWGVTHNGYTDTMNRARAMIMPYDDCKTKYYAKTNQDNICIVVNDPENDPTACYGDSGGPLVINADDPHPTVVGIVSYGKSRTCKGSLTLFVDVTMYREWVETTMADN